MPTKCSVVRCGATKNKNRPNLTFHRLPRNENKKRIWLEAIGKENIRANTKYISICSLHFDESSFNRTLDILRLRDEAIPSLILKRHSLDQPQPSMSNHADLLDNQQNAGLDEVLKEVHHLQEKVISQKRKIKCLNETVRRQKIKMATLQKVIKNLKQRNKMKIV